MLGKATQIFSSLGLLLSVSVHTDIGACKQAFKLNVYKRAAKLCMPLAKHGDAHAQTLIGVLYAFGQGGLPKDQNQAIHWYQLAADHGDTDGQVSLGVMYEFGDGGLTRNTTIALKYFRLAAAQGNAMGQNNIGTIYYYGLGGTKKDLGMAFKYYWLAAENGDLVGQYHLGVMYEKGEGVTKNLKDAIYWYRRAAKQGNKRAIRRLNQLEMNKKQDWSDR